MTLESNTETLAGHLYEEYCDAVGGVAFNGEPLPKWKEFRADPSKQKQSDGWIAVSKMVIRVTEDVVISEDALRASF